MAKFNLSNKAINDLADIWNYTFDTWSETQADNYYQMLIDTCNDFAKNPTLGKYYNKASQNLLGYRIGSQIIFYNTTDLKEIEIYRILHGQMDLPNRLKTEKPT